VPERGRVDWSGVWNPTLAGRFPDGGGEVLEAGRRRDLQGAQRLVRADEERVRQPHGQEHEVPRWLTARMREAVLHG